MHNEGVRLRNRLINIWILGSLAAMWGSLAILKAPDPSLFKDQPSMQQASGHWATQITLITVIEMLLGGLGAILITVGVRSNLTEDVPSPKKGSTVPTRPSVS